MSLDNIQIPPIILGEMFNGSLIALETQHKTKPAKEEGMIHYLGNNERNVCVLVADDNAAYLNDEELDLLTKILGACNLSLPSVALVNLSKQSWINYNALADQLQPKFVILFGLTPDAIEMPISFPNYQLQSFDNRSFLTAPSLKVLNTDIAAKKTLWSALKKMF